MRYIEVLQRTYAIVEHGEHDDVTCLITRGITTCAAIVGISRNAEHDKQCGLFLCHADVFTNFTEPLTQWAKENQEKALNITLHLTQQTESYHHIYSDQMAEIAKIINCPVNPIPLWETVYALRTGQLGSEELWEDEKERILTDLHPLSTTPKTPSLPEPKPAFLPVALQRS